MIRRPRFVSTALACALAAALLPASAVSAQTATPLRPAVRAQADPAPNLVLRGSGWGHSVGMSQYGAYAMARAGQGHQDILKHYYPGLEGSDRPDDAPQMVAVTQVTGSPANSKVVARNGQLTWLVCPVGSDCREEPQPKGEIWYLVSGGSSAPSRVTLCASDLKALTTTSRPTCPSASRRYSGNGTLQVRLSSRDVTLEAAGTYADFGSRQFAYGWLTVRGASGNLRVDNELPLENYVRGIDEVPSGWGRSGPAALRAQAIIARTYVLERRLATCATPLCQVFKGYGKELAVGGGYWREAVTSTAGHYLHTADGAVAKTYFSSSHGGRTEAIEDSWAYGGVKVGYLPSVDDPWSLDAGNPMRSWTAVATNARFRSVAGADLSRVQGVQIVSRTAGGSPRTLRVTGPEGTRDFNGGTGSCNRTNRAANALRCDLVSTIYDAAGGPFAGANGRPPSTQIHSIGFAPFTDDDGNIHEYATVWANAAGIAFGTSPTTFQPRSGVTRAQMASFLYRTFDIPKRTDESFTDVNGGAHAEAIASVTAAGIAHGYDSRRFGPDDFVTREQMASFIARAMGLSPVRPTFSDVKPSGTHSGNVGAIAARGVTSGCGGDRYCPSSTVTRDQMTTFLHRVVTSLR